MDLVLQYRGPPGSQSRTQALVASRASRSELHETMVTKMAEMVPVAMDASKLAQPEGPFLSSCGPPEFDLL